MPARIVHPYILAHHTTAHFPLPFVFQILPLYGNRRHLAKQIWFGQLACMQI